MSDRYEVRPIGVVHSPFTGPDGMPIQSGPDETRATVEIDPPYAEGLADLEGFERIWLLTWMDRARPFSLVVTPFMDGRPHGLFSTRAPSRPNPIGLSPVRLLGVRGNLLDVAGCDCLDGTPVLDIKPYAPSFDAFVESRAGWLEGRQPRQTRADDRFA